MRLSIVHCGSILDDPSDLLVCPTNRVGSNMGKGLAKAFADKWPILPTIKGQGAEFGGIIGIDPIIAIPVNWQHVAPYRGPCVVMLHTKRHYREKSDIRFVEYGLFWLLKNLRQRHEIAPKSSPKSVAIPALGCGLGGLDWDDVEPLILRFVADLPKGVHVNLYPPRES